tara:strand:+ start:290 stop:772 length:483 start_codon:yes stop_codon:yes gene_type:complete
MRLFVLIFTLSFIFSNEYNDSTTFQAEELNVKVANTNQDSTQSKNKKSDKQFIGKVFDITNKIENIFYLGIGLGSVLWIFLDGEAEFYHNKYTEYNDLYEFNNSYNKYLKKYEVYNDAAEISKYITLSSTILLIFNKFYKQKQSKDQTNNSQSNEEIHEF